MLLVSRHRSSALSTLWLGGRVHCGKVGGNMRRGKEMDRLGFEAGEMSGQESDVRRMEERKGEDRQGKCG